MHPRIFFRNEEFESMTSKNSLISKSIENEVNSEFNNISTLQQLYNKVELLDNSENIFNSFNYKTKNGYLEQGSFSNPYVDKHALGTQEVYGYHVESSSSVFYITIGFLLIFFLVILKQNKFLLKICSVILIALISFNLYNYFYVEPKIIQEYGNDYDFVEYKDMLVDRAIFRKFDSLYLLEKNNTNDLQTSNYHYEKYYEYDVTGTDEYNNNVYGKVEVDNEDGGDGVIYTEENNEIQITVKWTGKGSLEGEDDNGNLYELEVE